MDNLNYLKSSPTLQLLKQLDMPLAIAQKTAAFSGSLSHSSLMPAISESQGRSNRVISFDGLSF